MLAGQEKRVEENWTKVNESMTRKQYWRCFSRVSLDGWLVDDHTKGRKEKWVERTSER